jgi:drug/metabolite transporter (DMT)-like permease
MVPLFGPLVGYPFSSKALISGAIALCGLGLMSWEHGSFAIGDLWMVACALCYTAYILLLDAVVQNHAAIQLTAIQMVTVTLLALSWVLPELATSETLLPLPITLVSIVAYLGIVATAATTWGQAFAQRSVSAYETALLYTLEPVFALLFSFLWLHETIGIRGGMGASLIVLAMAASQLMTSAAETDVAGDDEMPVKNVTDPN